jgi:hypothetical protein
MSLYCVMLNFGSVGGAGAGAGAGAVTGAVAEPTCFVLICNRMSVCFCTKSNLAYRAAKTLSYQQRV